ncbi:hypothetical protein JA1_003378 [Spathaspora sp. JA1]|nr:hypothetical protein JA1_003378 [Spathaspora sp. JA1]
MSDQFGRQKSTRWQKAVPTYDWDNEYGYDDYDDEQGQEQQVQQPIPQKFELPEKLPPLPSMNNNIAKDNSGSQVVEPQEAKNPEEPVNELVLSVDRASHINYDSSDEEEDYAKQDKQDDKQGGEVGYSHNLQEDVHNSQKEEDTHHTLENIANSSGSLNAHPPPVPEPVPTPVSHPADTTKETFVSPPSSENKESFSENSSFNFDGAARKKLSPITTSNTQPQEEGKITETVLDHDFRKQLYQPPDTPMSETSFQSDYSIQKEPVELSLKGRNNNPETNNFQPPSSKPDMLPPMEPEPFVLSIDKKQFDSSDDDDWGYNSQHSSNLDQEEEHEQAVKGDSDSIDELIKDIRAETIDKHPDETNLPRDSSFGIYADYINYDDSDEEGRNSPIKPLSTAKLEHAHGAYVSSLSSRKPSVRKAPVIIEPSSKSDLNKVEESVNDLSNSTEALAIKSEQEEENKSDIDTSTKNEDSFEAPPNRRVSTISNATFNLGGWAPPTDNFRNQFINYQDNDSIREVPEEEHEQEHVKPDVASTSSAISVPETIDAAIPNVSVDQEDDEQPDVYSPSPVTGGDSQSINQTIMTATTVDSVLKDHQYTNPLFKEEKLTPGGSTDNLRPTSMLLGDDEKNKRRISEISAISTETETQRKSVSSFETTPTVFKPGKYPVYDWKKITTISQPIDRIAAYKDALLKEAEYDTGLQNWLMITLKQVDPDSHIHIGKIASDVYQNAPHNEIKRHGSILSKVSIVKDTGTHASNFGKKLFSKSKKFIRSSNEAK